MAVTATNTRHRHNNRGQYWLIKQRYGLRVVSSVRKAFITPVLGLVGAILLVNDRYSTPFRVGTSSRFRAVFIAPNLAIRSNH
jgi:hypothetical protein